MRKKFFLRNFILFVTPILVPIILLGTVSVLFAQIAIKEEVNINNVNALEQVEDRFATIYRQMDSLQLLFASDTPMAKGNKSVFQQKLPREASPESVKLSENLLEAMVRSNNFISLIGVYYESEYNNLVSFPTNPMSEGMPEDQSWYTSAISKEKHIKNWTQVFTQKKYAFHQETETTLGLFRRINDTILVINLRYRYLQDILENLGSGISRTYLVFDGDGRLVVTSRGESFDFFTYDEMLATSLAKKNVVHSKLSLTNHWRYVSVIPKKELYKTQNLILYITGILVLLFGTVGTLITYYQTKSNYKLVMDIIAITEAAERGEPLPKLEINSGIGSQYQYIINNILKIFVQENEYKMQVIEQKYRMQILEIHALQSQINPHFLNNTLHSIYWETIKISKKPNKATAMIENLSDILNYAFQNPEEQVALFEEIEYTKNYLDIMNIRYKGKFHVIWEVEQEAINLPMMKLIFQPFVENSIYHGAKQQTNKSGIKIKIRIKEDILHLTIIDNGIGMEKQRLEEIRGYLEKEVGPENHLGVHNTYKRLALKYQENLEFGIRSKKNLGTVVTIKIRQ